MTLAPHSFLRSILPQNRDIQGLLIIYEFLSVAERQVFPWDKGNCRHELKHKQGTLPGQWLSVVARESSLSGWWDRWPWPMFHHHTRGQKLRSPSLWTHSKERRLIPVGKNLLCQWIPLLRDRGRERDGKWGGKICGSEMGADWGSKGRGRADCEPGRWKLDELPSLRVNPPWGILLDRHPPGWDDLVLWFETPSM